MIFILTRIYDMMIVKKVFCEKHMRIFSDMKHILLLTRIYDRLFVKKCFVTNTGGSFFGYETYFSTYSDI